MITFLLIILLILIIIYLAYQQRKLSGNSAPRGDISSSSQIIFDSENEELENLIADRDEAIRDKKTLEQETLSLNNQLRNKQQEASRKDNEITRLKQEASQKEIALNGKLKEKNGLITTLQREVDQHKEKYSKQGKLLDEEQCENNKLTEKIEQLEAKIEELTRSSSPMPGEFPEENKDD